MHNQPFFTIITASLNNELSIPKTLESIATQCFQNFEHIVIDGKSTDKTTEIIEEYKSKYNLRVISEKDKGVYDALNKGVALANGQYIIIIQADDYLIKDDILKSAHTQLTTYKHDILCYTIGLKTANSEKITYFNLNRPFWLYHFKMIFPHQACFIHKKIYSQIGKFNTNYSISADYDFLYKAIKSKYKVKRINKPIVLMQSGGYSNNKEFLTQRIQEEGLIYRENENNFFWRVLQIIFHTLYYPYKTKIWVNISRSDSLMKIYFPLIQTNSGSSVWTKTLVGALQNEGVNAFIEHFPNFFQFAPNLLKNKQLPQCDIIHANSWNGFAFKQKKVPLVITEHLIVHDTLLNPYKNFPQRIFHKMILNFEKKSFAVANKATAVSNYCANQTKKIFNSNIQTIYNGIDTENFHQKETKNLLSIDQGKIILLFVGNMSIRKGADLLPAIMEKLGDQYILLCTTDIQNSYIKTAPNILSIGNLSQSELSEFYNYSDIFLFPTRVEGFGLTVAEAMSCNKPAVVTNGSSMPELIINGKGGFLCEMNNSDHFVEKIKILGNNKSMREQMGEFNRKRVEELFSLKLMARNYIKLYESLLK